MTADISVAPTNGAWTPPAGHTQTNGCWTPFLTGMYGELEQWACRHQVGIQFEELDGNEFGDYDPDTRGIRLDTRLTPRQVVSTLALECAHAALGAYGGNWQHQEQRANEEAAVMLVDPVAFAAALTTHRDAMEESTQGGPKRDYPIAADLDVMVWVVRSALRLWSTSVGDRLDRLTGWSVSEAAHRRWVEGDGAGHRQWVDGLLEANYRQAMAAAGGVQPWTELDD